MRTQQAGCIAMLVWLALGQIAFAFSDRCPQDNTLCGPQSLQVVFEHFGVEVELEELKELAGFDEKHGAAMLGLKQAAETKGLRAVGMKIGIDDIVGSDRLAIAHLWNNHFVVVEAGEQDSLKITDPPREPRLVPKEAFAHAYSGFALLVARDDSAFPKSESKGPDLRFDGYTFDFGFEDQGSEVRHTFSLRNAGQSELVLLNIEPRSAAAVAFTSADVIPPGATGEISVVFDTSESRGVTRAVLNVYSNDPITPVVPLSIQGVVKPPFVTLGPRSISFGHVKKGDNVERQLVIRDPGDGSLKIAQVETDSPHVSVILDEEQERGRYVIRVGITPDVPVGSFESELTIYTNHAQDYEIKVPVTAVVKGHIEVFPSTFFMGMLKEGEEVSRSITLSTSGEDSLEILEVMSPFDYVGVEVSPKVEGQEYILTAVLNENAPTGMTSGNVVIRTDDPNQAEIVVPVHAYIE